jgi:hypothetical protein
MASETPVGQIGSRSFAFRSRMCWEREAPEARDSDESDMLYSNLYP